MNAALARPQDILDTRALEKATAVEARQSGHEEVCSERYRNIDHKISDIRKEQDDFKRQQEQYHRDNQAVLRDVDEKIDSLKAMHHAQEGARKARLDLKDWILFLFTGGSALIGIIGMLMKATGK